jgi:biopolymer transport protein TolR
MNLSRVKNRQNRKQTKTAMLNLVSLMDIFTILVFFLMLNSSKVEVLETSTAIKLPDSVSQQKPEDRVVISISLDDVFVQGSRVVSVQEAMLGPDALITGLKAELDRQATQRKQGDGIFTGAITIMGDRTLPYELLKRIMRTCQHAEFTQIALAVNQIGREGA